MEELQYLWLEKDGQNRKGDGTTGEAWALDMIGPQSSTVHVPHNGEPVVFLASQTAGLCFRVQTTFTQSLNVRLCL